MRENVMNLEVVLADGRIINTAGEGRRTRYTEVMVHLIVYKYTLYTVHGKNVNYSCVTMNCHRSVLSE